jgi:anti-anti-sigma regulatory factor
MEQHVLTVGSRDDGAVLITLAGEFDAAAARALLRTVAIAASTRVVRVEIDLCGITALSEEGIHAVTACRRLSEQIPQGVGFRVSGLGRELLLASVARDRQPVAMPAAIA